MKKTFTINGNKYEAREFDFDMVCDFDELGLDLDSMFRKQMASIRVYFSICAGISKEQAGKELNEHIMNGGKLNELIEVFKDSVMKSDFFRAISEGAAESSAELEAPKTKAKK